MWASACRARPYVRGPAWSVTIAMTILTPPTGACTCKSEHDLSEKLGLEDHAAVACAIQNLMLSFAGDGVGSKWMTGALGAPPEAVLEAVGAGEVRRRILLV